MGGHITSIRTWGGFAWLAPVRDCCTKKVAGYAVADHMHTCLVCEAINMAVRNCPLRKGRTIFHSDRGRQYISEAFTQHRKGYGMARIKQDRCVVV